MSQVNERVSGLFSESIPALVGSVADGKVSSARARFTAPNGPIHHNFWWIQVDKIEGDDKTVKLFARTNDIDLMVGIPPSFHMAVPLDEAASLVPAIVAFLNEKLGRYDRVEILLQADPIRGGEHIPNYEGDSDAGFANIHPQAELAAC